MIFTTVQSFRINWPTMTGNFATRPFSDRGVGEDARLARQGGESNAYFFVGVGMSSPVAVHCRPITSTSFGCGTADTS